MADAPLLCDVLRQHLQAAGISARALAFKIGASYPSMLAWLRGRGIPRKEEHREALRRELALQPDVFHRVLAASIKESGIEDFPDESELDLRQLVLRHLETHHLTERTFADLSGIPYATLQGITRRGALPRASTLEQLAHALGLPLEVVREAAQRTRGEAEAAGHPVTLTTEVETHAAPPSPVSVGSVSEAPSAPMPAPASELARRVSERIAASGLTIGTYARTHNLPYIPLARLVSEGIEPSDPAVREAIVAAFTAGNAEGGAAGGQGGEHPTRALHRFDRQTHPLYSREPAPGDHPLQDALLRLCRERGWSQQQFARAAGIAVQTASRLLRGELPVRDATHAKLRELLGLDEAAYRALLPPEPAHVPGDAERAGSAEDGDSTTEALDLARQIMRLQPGQRRAVKRLVKTLRRE
ncbi:MAG: helix-turn-helix domain-containing protein [Planctomycetes bacterium]|nr:helix-turn-helix domain-containing protein [Planctomycetota bacterium]